MEQSDIFKKYVQELQLKKRLNKNKNTWEFANPWASKKSADWYADCWQKIEASGLSFDGKHITLNENGVSYDYVAYKNKMLLAYPETEIDVELVYKGDTFTFAKENGVIQYKHIYINPFAHQDKDIIGGYCIIKNKRGEFLTLLSKSEIEKAKAIAKTKAIWDAWYPEMCKKTVIKKAVKFHFDDIYAQMEEEDNRNYDVETQVKETEQLPEALVNAINEAPDYEALKGIYKREYSGLGSAALQAEFIALSTARKEALINEQEESK